MGFPIIERLVHLPGELEGKASHHPSTNAQTAWTKGEHEQALWFGSFLVE